ncbi:MAG: hypothetical protein M4579_007085 [Chaenotheca gracillima]|nr:MAG: hypothetical protein M4579_007085 [Chaenotheca gracillima]
MTGTNAGTAEEYWIFGYGSLIWKPPPHYDRRIPGYIEGYVRRFWQHASTRDQVWGVAYRIAPSRVEEVKSYLDIREINGYSIHETLFHPAASPVEGPDGKPGKSALQPIKLTVYIGTPSNPQFTGPQDPQALAEHIWKSRGPSGDNKEYLLMLDQSMDDLCKESGDGHVSDLALRVREIERRAGTGGGLDVAKSVGLAGQEGDAKDPLEETEKDQA